MAHLLELGITDVLLVSHMLPVLEHADATLLHAPCCKDGHLRARLPALGCDSGVACILVQWEGTDVQAESVDRL